ncbi:MAG: fasciclin domain-containing protein [Verrucomicrobia bacterium]|nr:fasciclin domain-containing protein [Verrucomicrobiota bacterium]
MKRTIPFRFCSWSIGAMLMLAGSTLADTIQVTAPLTGVVQWYRTNEYVLNGFIYALEGAELHIEAGTVIKGTADPVGALVVTRGAKIFANGTAQNPIIMTALDDDVNNPGTLGIYERGLWGGLTLLGRARINTSSNVAGDAATPKYDVYEGLEDIVVNGQNVHRLGGDDDQDSSGVLRYLSVRHAGVVFAANKEFNGISFGAVGEGTVVEFCEAYAVADDGFEFFGGKVNTKYMVSAFNDDDSFDTDQGFRGKHQFVFVIQEPGKVDKSAELNGEPNDIGVGAEPVANFTVYNATFIGAGQNAPAGQGANNNAFTVRWYAAPRFYNSIFTDFSRQGISIDSRSDAHLQSGLLDFRDNLWWGFNNDNTVANLAVTPNAAVLFEDAARNNRIEDPKLLGISRVGDGGLDPRLAPDSPAWNSPRTAPADGFYTPVNYIGAFDDNDLWIANWTALSAYGIVAPRAANTIQVTAPLTGVVQWYRTNEYVLNGFIYALEGAELHIEAGTVIKGTADPVGALVVTRGAKIFANGTAQNPIIMTALDDDVNNPGTLGIYERGLWGGLTLLGRARINTSSNVAGDAATPKYDVYEGLEDIVVNGQNVHRLGGDDDQDSSGVLRYLSVRHAGVVFAANKEFNGISFGAVGEGTVVEFCEAYAVADDGFEFFGGKVNTKYMVSAFNDDDSFDTDQGFRGKHQFVFVIQEPGKVDKSAELNGEPNDIGVGAEPVANFTVYNATFIGAGQNAPAGQGANNNAFTVRWYAAPRFYNSIFTDFSRQGISIDSRSDAHLQSGLLDFRDNLWWGFNNDNTVANLAVTPNAAVLFEDAARNNRIEDPKLLGISRVGDGGLDPRLAPDSPAWNSPRTAPADGFYTPVNYIGAFADYNWAGDWTAVAAYHVFSNEGVRNPLPLIAPVTEPDLVELLASREDLSTLVAAVQAAGLTNALAGEGPLTVFAPNNAAFAALGQELIDELLQDPERLTAILLYHAVAARALSSDLTTGPLTTVAGADVQITITGDTVKVNEATVIEADLLASNGVAHIIDQVLLPPTPQAPTLVAGIEEGQIAIQTPTEAGRSYQLQSTADLMANPIEWVNVGEPVTGTGEPIGFRDAMDAGAKYYRIAVD